MSTSPPPERPTAGPPNRPARASTLPDPLPTTDLRCADCGAGLELLVGTWGLYWACVKHAETGCKGHIGAHQESGRPLGIPADAETRLARKAVHAQFDLLWKYGDDGRKTRRRRAYAWLALALGIPGEAHVSDFDRPTCERVLALLATVTQADLDAPAVTERADHDRRDR